MSSNLYCLGSQSAFEPQLLLFLALSFLFSNNECLMITPSHLHPGCSLPLSYFPPSYPPSGLFCSTWSWWVASFSWVSNSPMSGSKKYFSHGAQQTSLSACLAALSWCALCWPTHQELPGTWPMDTHFPVLATGTLVTGTNQLWLVPFSIWWMTLRWGKPFSGADWL